MIVRKTGTNAVVHDHAVFTEHQAVSGAPNLKLLPAIGIDPIEKLRRVGLKPEQADLYPAELSGGMQKRVGLARAIAAEPEIIFFDEPTTGLDPIMAGVINDLIREIVTEMGATAMTITHDMTSVRAIADNVAMLHDGVIQWTGPVSEMDASGDPYLAQFITGSPDGPIEAVR